MKNIVDLTYLETVCEGDTEFMQEMIQAFVSTVPDNMSEIRGFAANGNWAEVGKVAHKMKPSVTFMGIEPMKEKILELESGAKNGAPASRLQQLIEEIEVIVNQAVVELNAHLSRMQ